MLLIFHLGIWFAV